MKAQQNPRTDDSASFVSSPARPLHSGPGATGAVFIFVFLVYSSFNATLCVWSLLFFECRASFNHSTAFWIPYAAPWQHENRRARRGDTLALSPSLAAVAAAAAATSACVSWKKDKKQKKQHHQQQEKRQQKQWRSSMFCRRPL